MMDRRMDTIDEKVIGDIKRAGQSVIYVGGGEDGFAYTVGRTTRGLPELLIAAALDPETAQALLNYLDGQMPERLPSGSLVDLGGRFPVRLLDAVDPLAFDQFACMAWRFYGEKATVQQVVLCDRQGRFPPHCAAPFSRQPLLGASTH